jgi:hypothetical protein
VQHSHLCVFEASIHLRWTSVRLRSWTSVKVKQVAVVMRFSISLLSLAALAETVRSVLLDPARPPPESRIQWTPCPAALNVHDAHKRTFQCGILAVPLDYSDSSSNQTLNLDIIKIPAIKDPKKGSILFNWGGPGGDGLNNMARLSSVVQP